MPIKLTIELVQSNSGDEVSIISPGVTAIVGGNNAGKSQLLRDINNAFHASTFEPVVLAGLRSTQPSGTIEEAGRWLAAEGIAKPLVSGSQQTYMSRTGQSDVGIAQFHQFFSYSAGRPLPWMGPSAPFFVHLTSAGSLASHAAGAVPMGIAGGAMGQLYRSGILEEELAALAKASFNVNILLDRANTDFRLRVGETDVPVPPLNRPTEEYARALASLPLLDEQGDGMKSFVGLALLIMATAPDVLLVDEPEAFLHPSQARALGRWIGDAAHRRGIQIVLATHDRDLVLGLLEATGPVNIVRLVRVGSTNHLAQLPPEEIDRVWSDPVLRYSNVLQGLFHRRVVICEGDADCRFYSAALSDLAERTDRRAVADDVLLVPSGSKNRVAAIARALRALNVEACAIVDFDVLRNRADIEAIVVAVGGTWTPEIHALFISVVDPVQQGGIWHQVKNQGLAAVPAGAPNVAAVELLVLLANLGIHVVPVGEMEGFDRTQSLHGAGWVSAAIESDVHISQTVANFVERLLAA